MSPERRIPRQPAVDAAELARQSEALENPLAHKSETELLIEVEKFCNDYGLAHKIVLFKRASLLAANPEEFEGRDDITEKEKVILREEITHKWRHPWSMYHIAIISSLAAVVQGMDESVINGAMAYYFLQFGLERNNDTLIQGLVNSAPYLCCFVLTSWLTKPLNHYFGRRGTIWISCLIGGAASIWEAFTYSWQQLFVARFVLGLGIGPMSTTAPVYSAECSPVPIRGALVMMWKMWTAFGIMLGFVVGIVFAPSARFINENTAWRLMLGSTVVGPIFVCAMIYYGPESPRWYIKNDRYPDAFKSMCRLRRSELQAARDLYSMRATLAAESDMKKGKFMLKETIIVPRNRRAMAASGLVMFMQQVCGITVITYYSNRIFVESGFTLVDALYVSLGAGVLNWLFTIPAFWIIDTFGRRSLLLVTLPLLAVCLLITGFAFFIPGVSDNKVSLARVVTVTLGIYLFGILYSPGKGPVPFTYAAEAFPLYIRDLGMSYATSVAFCFNFVLKISLPNMLVAFKPQGTFAYYAGWCVVGWVAVFLILPETKSLTLGQLDHVFSVPHRRHIRYQIAVLKYQINRLLGKSPEPVPPLYAFLDKLLIEA